MIFALIIILVAMFILIRAFKIAGIFFFASIILIVTSATNADPTPCFLGIFMFIVAIVIMCTKVDKKAESKRTHKQKQYEEKYGIIDYFNKD